MSQLRVGHLMKQFSTIPVFIIVQLFFMPVGLLPGELSNPMIGPLVGYTDSESTIIWARVPSAGYYTAEYKKFGHRKWQAIESEAVEANDLCLTWKVKYLEPNTKYQYRIMAGNSNAKLRFKRIRKMLGNQSAIMAEGEEYYFKTSPDINTASRVSIAFGSGAKDDDGSRAVWDRIASSNVDAVILLGDTPYIDSTILDVQRRRYREFSSITEFQNLMRSTPFLGTWDDHDFGANDSDGLLPGKENSLKAFIEYRPNKSFGDGNEGVYTKLRYGPVEIFLLDTRWWSWTGPSFADSTKKTLLGNLQWQWLTEALRSSDASFKLIACGMIWDDKENREKDDWGTYLYERDALFSYIGKEKIPGVILIGGDIHVSRVLRYKTEEQIGYPLYQFITSPIHGKVIPSLNVPHPDLIRDAVHPHTFMKITVDTMVKPAILVAEFIDKDGERLFEDVKVNVEQLSAQ